MEPPFFLRVKVANMMKSTLSCLEHMINERCELGHGIEYSCAFDEIAVVQFPKGRTICHDWPLMLPTDTGFSSRLESLILHH